MAVGLEKSVTTLKGVGPKRAEALADLGIETISDLLHHFPFRHQDLTVQNIEEVTDKQKIVLAGRVLRPPTVNYFGPRRSRLTFMIEAQGIAVPIVFFNQPYLKESIVAGRDVQVFGTWNQGRAQLNGSRLLRASGDGLDLESIYPASQKIKQATITRLIKQAWTLSVDSIPEILPPELLKKYHLYSYKETLAGIHFPKDESMNEQALRTYAFMELIGYNLRLLHLKHRRQEGGLSLNYDVHALRAFFDTFPYELTNAQKRVINEISADLKRPLQMFRLVQGDVGSGKTVVAAAAIFAAYSAKGQAALMAPTEILAEQHYETLVEMFEPTNLNVGLLTGSTPAAERKELLQRLADGKIDVLVGTHALIQESVVSSKLRLVIIDEQHRFGVNQRRALRQKGERPDVLLMTATPIPRTLSLTTFNELDVSSIDELPPGRQPVHTYWMRPAQLPAFFGWLRPQVTAGKQMYVISPLIDNEDSELESVTSLADMYRKHLPDTVTIETLHGQMPAEDKTRIIAAFKNKQVDVLISTTVIEVGVDARDAVGMIIHHADRFGLSQLHQLRGRVGRGDLEAFCMLVAEPKTEEGKRRMQIMVDTRDGFKISQEDLKMRGPGDWFGREQSGAPEFKVADLAVDHLLAETAHYEAQKIMETLHDGEDQKWQPLLSWAQVDDQMSSTILD